MQETHWSNTWSERPESDQQFTAEKLHGEIVDLD